MNEDLKIYTAAEVASVGYSKEKIDEALATITQEAYACAKRGGDRVIYPNYNLKLLNEIGSRLEELGYTIEISAKLIGNPCIIVRWNSD